MRGKRMSEPCFWFVFCFLKHWRVSSMCALLEWKSDCRGWVLALPSSLTSALTTLPCTLGGRNRSAICSPTHNSSAPRGPHPALHYVCSTLPTGFLLLLQFTLNSTSESLSNLPKLMQPPPPAATRIRPPYSNSLQAFISTCCPLIYLLVCLMTVSTARM